MRDIYLDSAATTRPDPQCLIDYTMASIDYPYNPSSVYEGGLDARNLLEDSRRKIANHVGCLPEEIIFTSGGTEGNNMIIRGFFEGKKEGLFITTQIEHPSVLRVAEYLENNTDITVYYLPVDSLGELYEISLDFTLELAIKEGIKPDDILVSIQAANNELGVAQNMEKIYQICGNHSVWLHSDQVQLFPHYGANLNCDSFTVSGHKFGALRGTGFVYMSKDFQKQFLPYIKGGGQEMGLRAGTENVAGYYALANQIERLKFEDDFLNFALKIREGLDDIEYKQNGYPHIPILSLTFPGVEASALVSLLGEKGIYISAGSACHNYSPEPSHVLQAIGLSDEDAKSTIRICYNSELTDEDVDYFLEQLKFYVKLLRGV